MIHRLLRPLPLLALLALLLPGIGCGVPETSDVPAGTTEIPEGTETLGYYEADFEVLAVGPELTRYEERGRMIFLHYCAHCHGSSGAGDGQNSYGLETPPRDLLAVELDDRSDEELRQVITDGGAAHGFSMLMPPWGHTLEPHRITDLVMLIRVLPDLAAMEEESEVPSLDGGDEEMSDFSL